MSRETIKSQVVTTKKQHNCYGCGRVFKSGTLMISAVCKINGSLGSKYFCNSCYHTMTIKGKTIDKFWYGELLCEALAYENSKRNK